MSGGTMKRSLFSGTPSARAVSGGRDAGRERLREPEDVLALDRALHTAYREGGFEVIAENARVGVRRADDRRVVEARDGRMVVDVRPAPGEEARVLDALHRLADP